MARVVDIEASTHFYGRLLMFLGFEVEAGYPDSAGWTAGHTLFRIARAENTGNPAFNHCAFRLRSRKDVDNLKATIVDPAGAYHDDYYAVFFLDPDGMQLAGMRYGELSSRTV